MDVNIFTDVQHDSKYPDEPVLLDSADIFRNDLTWNVTDQSESIIADSHAIMIYNVHYSKRGI